MLDARSTGLALAVIVAALAIATRIAVGQPEQSIMAKYPNWNVDGVYLGMETRDLLAVMGRPLKTESAHGYTDRTFLTAQGRRVFVYSCKDRVEGVTGGATLEHQGKLVVVAGHSANRVQARMGPPEIHRDDDGGSDLYHPDQTYVTIGIRYDGTPRVKSVGLGLTPPPRSPIL